MQTMVLEAAQHGVLASAVKFLQQGDIVALPTETVYGLAGDAFNPLAVARIYEAKNRPNFDPLIVHVLDEKMMLRVAKVESDLVSQLIQKFWPGPLTLILPKCDCVPDLVTSGSPLVAVRMPSHPIFRAVLEAFGNPLAAPSANPFGKISPTSAEHVLQGLDGRIPLILDAGNCVHGLESTIVYPQNETLHLLRAGPVLLEELLKIAPVEVTQLHGREAAPGQLVSHYAPRKPLCLVDSLDDIADRDTSGYLAFSQVVKGFAAVEILSAKGDFVEAASCLFAALHRLDAAPVSKIYAERLPLVGLGRAIMDRLSRAAGVSHTESISHA